MVLDPQRDGPLSEGIYGSVVPSLVDMAPPPSTNEAPWDWIPASWRDDEGDDQLHRALSGQQQVGPGPTAVGAPPELAAAPPAAPAQSQTEAATTAPAGPPAPVPAPDLGAAPMAPPLGTEPSIQLPFAAQPPPITDLPSARPGVPDAVSTAEGMSPKGEVAGEAYAPARTAEQQYRDSAKKLTESPFDPATGDLRSDVSDADAQRYMNDLATRDPAKFAEVSTQLADIKTKRALAEKARIADADWKVEQANHRARTEAIRVANAKAAAIDADAQRIANTKIDPTGGLSGGQRIAGVLGAIIGGLVQGRTGSARNAGMDALNDVINRGIEMQKANLANQREGIAGRRSALAEEYARTNDTFHAQEVIRLAALKHADETLATEQQKYSPRGTSFQKIASLRAQVGAAQAEAKAKVAQTYFDNSLKASKQATEEMQQREVMRHNRASEGIDYAKIKSEEENRKLQRQLHASDKADERADKAAERVRQFAIGGIPKVQTDPDGKPVMGPDGKPTITYDVLRNDDNTVWEAESPEATRELRQKKTSATEVISIIDEIRAIRNRVGGESKLLNSDEAQRLEVLQNRAKLLTKAGTQGMSSDKDMDTIEGASGTSDASSWRSQDAKLAEARARTASSLNTAFRDAKYRGPVIAFPEGGAKTEDTPEEIRNQRLFQKPDVSFDDAARRDLLDAQRAAGKEMGLDASNPEDQAVISGSLARTRADWDPAASPEQQRGIRELGIAARGDDANGAAARALLGKLAEEAQTTKLRSLAKSALEEAGRAGVSSPEGTTTATDTPARRRSGPVSTAAPPVVVPPALTMGGQ